MPRARASNYYVGQKILFHVVDHAASIDEWRAATVVDLVGRPFFGLTYLRRKNKNRIKVAFADAPDAPFWTTYSHIKPV
jgi:hypothetical protein